MLEAYGIFKVRFVSLFRFFPPPCAHQSSKPRGTLWSPLVVVPQVCACYDAAPRAQPCVFLRSGSLAIASRLCARPVAAAPLVRASPLVAAHQAPLALSRRRSDFMPGLALSGVSRLRPALPYVPSPMPRALQWFSQPYQQARRWRFHWPGLVRARRRWRFPLHL